MEERLYRLPTQSKNSRVSVYVSRKTREVNDEGEEDEEEEEVDCGGITLLLIRLRYPME